MPTGQPADHRARVGAERRERMRRRLVESAMVVFAQKGIGSSVIQDVIATAEVSQGSFYNYFRTNEDLLRAVAGELSNEIFVIIESVVGEIDDPARKIATAIRSYLHLARSYRVVAQFLSSAGLVLATRGSLGFEYLPRDLMEGQRRGLFDPGPVEPMAILIGGAGLMAIQRMAIGRVPKHYPEDITRLILRSLGMSETAATALISLPLPKLVAPPGSLLARAQARLSAKSGAGKSVHPSAEKG